MSLESVQDLPVLGIVNLHRFVGCGCHSAQVGAKNCQRFAYDVHSDIADDSRSAWPTVVLKRDRSMAFLLFFDVPDLCLSRDPNEDYTAAIGAKGQECADSTCDSLRGNNFMPGLEIPDPQPRINAGDVFAVGAERE